VTVVLSGSQREADMKHAYAMGANSYLVKPNDFTNFLRTVELCDGYWRLNHVPNSRPKSKIANSAELE
jgi:DNA-binding NarL/FixJ family response regulator